MKANDFETYYSYSKSLYKLSFNDFFSYKFTIVSMTHGGYDELF